jgi:hypothetical protein
VSRKWGRDLDVSQLYGPSPPATGIPFRFFFTFVASIIRMLQSKRMRLVGYVAVWRRKGMHIGWESLKERDHQEDLDIGGRIILKWILDRMGCYGLD